MESMEIYEDLHENLKNSGENPGIDVEILWFFFDFLMLLVLKFWMSKKPELHHTGPPWNPPVFFRSPGLFFREAPEPMSGKKNSCGRAFHPLLGPMDLTLW